MENRPKGACFFMEKNFIEIKEDRHEIEQSRHCLLWFDSSMFVDKGCFYINAKTKAQLQKIINDYDSEWSQLEFKQQLKLHDLLITDKHQPYVKSVYSLGGATLTKGAAYKYLLIPVNKLKEFCKSMGAEISDNAKDTKKEDIA